MFPTSPSGGGWNTPLDPHLAAGHQARVVGRPLGRCRDGTDGGLVGVQRLLLGAQWEMMGSRDPLIHSDGYDFWIHGYDEYDLYRSIDSSYLYIISMDIMIYIDP